MGTIKYEGVFVEFGDRPLAHLHAVMVRKFLRKESFSLSWLDAVSVGDGRSAIWLHPHTDIYFKFAGSRVPTLNPQWLARLMAGADSPDGLTFVDEDDKPIRADGALGQRVGTT